jgi:predicted metal-dependent hydrolase
VREKLSWIRKKQRLAREAYKPPVAREFFDGEEFLFLGEGYKFFVVDHKLERLDFNGKEFRLAREHHSRASSFFAQWYKKQAGDIIGQRVRYYADQAGLSYRRVAITNARKRWGSCGSRGSLNFPWRLIMAPMEVVDYVAAHEVAHLEHKNHSKKFWDKTAVLCPHYRQSRLWLKQNSALLSLF